MSNGFGTKSTKRSKDIHIPQNANDTAGRQHTGLIHLAFGAASAQEVDAMAAQLKMDGRRILSGPRRTGDGYYEFETLDPDGNRIEVTSH